MWRLGGVFAKAGKSMGRHYKGEFPPPDTARDHIEMQNANLSRLVPASRVLTLAGKEGTCFQLFSHSARDPDFCLFSRVQHGQSLCPPRACATSCLVMRGVSVAGGIVVAFCGALWVTGWESEAVGA